MGEDNMRWYFIGLLADFNHTKANPASSNISAVKRGFSHELLKSKSSF